MKPITHSNSPLRTTKQSSKKNKSNRSNSNFECDSQDDLQAILENVVDEEYIRKVSLAEDLNTLTILNMRVDTSIQSIYDMGVLLPNLMSLTLDYSKVSSIRDLGVGLKHIHSLSMVECNLRDIDGIGVFSLLKQLNLNDNNLNEISALAMHEVLEVGRLNSVMCYAWE